jgi:hypothetical protein
MPVNAAIYCPPENYPLSLRRLRLVGLILVGLILVGLILIGIRCGLLSIITLVHVPWSIDFLVITES